MSGCGGEDSLMLIKQELDVSYAELNSSIFKPSTLCADFYETSSSLVNGQQGDPHKTPPVVESKSDYIANLCFRGGH
jgi:hypothetical protein